MTTKTQKTTPVAPKKALSSRRKASTRTSLAAVSTANDHSSRVPPPGEAPTPAPPALAAIAQAPSALDPTHDEIARRAYFIYLDRVGASSDAERDWVEALSELRQERGLNGPCRP